MLNITASVRQSDPNYQAVIEAVAFLKKREVCIGIPENTASRKDSKDTPVSNAELLFIHTNGSPINNIPPRPVLEPAIKQNKERVSQNMKKAVDAALAGRKQDILPALENAGMDGQNIARKFFTDSTNNWKPNKPATIKRKGSEGSARPLIDTDEMRKSITYVVREVGST
jgi:hypothetical protein